MTEMILVLVTLCVVLGLLASNRFQADLVLMVAVAFLVVSHILTPSEALFGFTNPAIMTIALLYVVVAGLQTTGAVGWISQFLLGKSSSLRGALGRVLLSAMTLSAFMNNSPVVAVFTSTIQNWVKRTNYNSSQLLMPLSFAAIIGGTCTLIGTSTNLVIDGLARDAGLEGFSLFELAYVGIPISIVGFVYLLLFSSRLLRARGSSDEKFENFREYMVEMRVEEGCDLIGKTVEEAGLRHLPGLFLVEIVRGDSIITSVSPTTLILYHDQLVFVGAVESVIELRSIRGLTIANNQNFKIGGKRQDRRLFEAVVAPQNPIVGKSIRTARFRHRYNAAVLAVARDGMRLKGKVGDIVIAAGDTLLLEAQKGFLFKHQYSREFLLINRLEDTVPLAHEKAPLAISIVVVMILLSAFEVLPITHSALVAAGVMMVSGCVDVEGARKAIDYRMLLTISMAFALGIAMQKTGVADTAVSLLLENGQLSTFTFLILLYVLTALLTEFVTNNAAAIVMFPIAVSAAQIFETSVMPFLVAIMVAASASFLTPIGYQTNLMVQGPGGYRFGDYFKLGLPLSILTATITCLIIPYAWPF